MVFLVFMLGNMAKRYPRQFFFRISSGHKPVNFGIIRRRLTQI